MKKVIKGHVYDTDKATQIAYWDNTYPTNDLNFCKETLYRTKSGLYFVHGEGGALSRYAEPCDGNGWQSGELIRPISVSDARAWAEEHMDGDAYIAAFGDPDSEDVHMISANISEGAYRKLRDAATEKDMSMAALIESMIDAL